MSKKTLIVLLIIFNLSWIVTNQGISSSVDAKNYLEEYQRCALNYNKLQSITEQIREELQKSELSRKDLEGQLKLAKNNRPKFLWLDQGEMFYLGIGFLAGVILIR